MKNGILIAGNIIVDEIKKIDVYPAKSMIAHVLSVDKQVGGCVCNTIIDLAKIDNTQTLKAAGMVGNDSLGEYVIGEMEKNGVDCKNVVVNAAVFTSNSSVMSDVETNSRTFFSFISGCSAYGEKEIREIDFEGCGYFHLGYLFLLNELDKEDEEEGTVAAKCLKYVQLLGLKTSVDLISDSELGKNGKIKAALRYCDNLIINEVEGGLLTGIAPRDEKGILLDDNVEKILRTIRSYGVKERIIIHCPERAYCLSEEGFVKVDSLKLPNGYIKGSVGAGDAFCAGALYRITKYDTPENILRFANCTAACPLSEVDSVSGMKDWTTIEAMMKNHYE